MPRTPPRTAAAPRAGTGARSRRSGSPRSRRGLCPTPRILRRGMRLIKPRRRPNRVPAALGNADQALLRLLRTRGHAEPVETAMQTLGMAGEFGSIWAGIGAVGASVDERRRGQWLAAGLVGPVAIGVNYLVKVA